jgi:L1 cell adhesion molecule like protein
MNAAEAFLEDTFSAHILAAACQILGVPPSHLWEKAATIPDTFHTVKRLAEEIANTFVHINEIGRQNHQYPDEVLCRTKDTISLLCIWKEYHDATREGDGERVVRVWKYLLLIFRRMKFSNYAKEAATFLTQLFYMTSPRLQAEFKHSRFVNVTGGAGHNIPCDLHMEHLNR